MQTLLPYRDLIDIIIYKGNDSLPSSLILLKNMDLEQQSQFKSSFTRGLDWKKSKGLGECRDVVDDICNSISGHYKLVQYVTNSRQKNQAIPEYFKSRNCQVQSLFDQLNPDGFIRVVDKYNDILPIKTRFHHVRVHKQFVPNLCGYHATYNLVQAVHAIKYEIPVQFENIASFWSYVHHTQQFLMSYRTKMRLDSSQWPWTDDDITKGDFERTYFKVCTQQKPLFKSTFVDEVYNGVSFTVKMNCLYYQYGNIVNDYKEREQFEKYSTDIQEFLKFKHEKRSEFILATMLGVTNHWLSLIAHKSHRGIHFYIMDSRNRDFFLWSEQEIKDFLIQENIERSKKGLEVWGKFYLDLYEQGMKDIQKCVDLVISLFTGQITMDSYVNNSRMKVFLEPIMSKLKLSEMEYLNYKVTDQQELYVSMFQWAQAYITTIEEYLYLSMKQISLQNQKLLKKTVNLVENTANYEIQMKLWNNPKKKSYIARVLQHLQLIQSRI